MKKIFLTIFSLIIVSQCVFADHDERFFNALSTCKSYTSNGSVETQGITADYKSQILGWSGDKCLYKETIGFSGIESCVTCSFTQNHIDELVKVMKAYQTIQQYSDEEIDLSDLENVKDNPVVKAWNKYLQDPNVCTMDIGGELGNQLQNF